MKINAKDFFSSTEREKIRQAVQKAETATSGEIAVVMVHESDPYPEGRILGAFSLSSLLSLILSLAFHHTTIWFFVPVTILFLFPSLFLFRRLPHMKLAFVSRNRVNHAVKERAVYAFFQKGVYKTEDRTGILIFISLLERRVWIIGDEGIHQKTEADFWRSLVRELTQGLKDGRVFEALSAVIEKCGAELTRHFPNRGAKTNQLKDDICCE